ncbi:MAG TPA: hypothetical protein VF182_04905 [Candidatus Binatia bacterium]
MHKKGVAFEVEFLTLGGRP